MIRKKIHFSISSTIQGKWKHLYNDSTFYFYSLHTPFHRIRQSVTNWSFHFRKRFIGSTSNSKTHPPEPLRPHDGQRGVGCQEVRPDHCGLGDEKRRISVRLPNFQLWALYCKDPKKKHGSWSKTEWSTHYSLTSYTHTYKLTPRRPERKTRTEKADIHLYSTSNHTCLRGQPKWR